MEEQSKDRLNKDHLDVLLKISSSLNASLNLEEVLNNAMDLVIDLLQAERGLIMLLEKNTLAVKITRGFEEKDIEKGHEISHGVIEQVFHTGQPVITVNAMDDKRFSNRKSVIFYGLRSVLCVPLTRSARHLGVIYLDNRWKTGVFKKQDLETLVTFANLTAIAIENARLYQNLKQSVDEKLRLQEAVFKAQTRAQIERETSRLREELAHYIVHDLRNPLTVVMSAFSLLEPRLKTLPNISSNELMIFQKAKENIYLFGKMLNDILDVYLLENNKVQLKPTTFDLAELAEKVLHNLSPLKRPHVRFEVAFQNKPLFISADKDMIQRVLENLVRNACQFTDKGYVKICGGLKPGAPNWVVVDVIDSGKGIPEAYREKIFSKFVRVEMNGNLPGSKGLGLAFCKLVVASHGGQITAQENPQGGAVIHVEIPCRS